MLSEIGSNFWISPEQMNAPVSDIDIAMFSIHAADFVWLSSCRSAISLAIENIESRKPQHKKIAILPAYTCETVVEPFLKRQYETNFFSLDTELKIDPTQLLNLCEKGANGIVLFHRYFGFDTLFNIDKILDQIKKYNISIIEDRTQCLYSETSPLDADFWVGSIRKWCGVADGGFLASKEGLIKNKPVCSDSVLEQKKITASLMKYRYLFQNEGDKSDYLAMYREAENILDLQKEAYKIAPVSNIIQNSLDIENMKKARRNNYQYVKENCQARPLFENFYETVTPLYYPIVVADRKSLQEYLRSSSIYAPIIWPKADFINDKSCDQMYREMLCLPIDQRYDLDDMERMVKAVNSFMNL